MGINNVEIHQLGKKQMAVVFNKAALKALQSGGASGCQLTVGNKRVKMLFMRDTAYHQRMSEFKQIIAKEEREGSFWNKVKGWFTWRK